MESTKHTQRVRARNSKNKKVSRKRKFEGFFNPQECRAPISSQWRRTCCATFQYRLADSPKTCSCLVLRTNSPPGRRIAVAVPARSPDTWSGAQRDKRLDADTCEQTVRESQAGLVGDHE